MKQVLLKAREAFTNTLEQFQKCSDLLININYAENNHTELGICYFCYNLEFSKPSDYVLFYKLIKKYLNHKLYLCETIMLNPELALETIPKRIELINKLIKDVEQTIN